MYKSLALCFVGNYAMIPRIRMRPKIWGEKSIPGFDQAISGRGPSYGRTPECQLVPCGVQDGDYRCILLALTGDGVCR